MNPKEVSYSHPQLPLCDTPNLLLLRPIAERCCPSDLLTVEAVVFRKESQN